MIARPGTNRLGTDVKIAVPNDHHGEDRVYYYASEHSSSAAGKQLATAIATSAGGGIEGRASAMLKETRAPAAVVSRRSLSEKLGLAVAEGLHQFFADASATR